MYARSDFRSGGTCERTLVPVFVPGNIRMYPRSGFRSRGTSANTTLLETHLFANTNKSSLLSPKSRKTLWRLEMRCKRVEESRGKSWKVVESRGIVESCGKSWKVMENHGKSLQMFENQRRFTRERGSRRKGVLRELLLFSGESGFPP